MPKSDKDRYDHSIAYLRQIDKPLGDDVNNKIPDKDNAGKLISLGDESRWHGPFSNQHAATRAYLLCILAYFRAPVAKMDYSYVLAGEKTRLKSKSEAKVILEIRSFLADPGASFQGVVLAATQTVATLGALSPLWPTRTRKDNYLGPGPICYDGVKSWLYASGWVGRRWLGSATKLDGNNSNQYLGMGTEVAQGQWGQIPLGYVWNIHKREDLTTCHWGVSLGNGKAAACNNTDGGQLHYDNPGGDTKYGVFTFTQLCTILDGDQKYQLPGRRNNPLGNLIIRQINPSTIVNR